MTYRRRHRWLRRLALGLAFATFVAPAAARPDEGGGGLTVVTAGGWTGAVDPETGIPLSAGIPHGDEQQAQGRPDGDAIAFKNAIETQAAAAAQKIHDPYLTDVYVRQGESLGGPDGEELAFAKAVVAAAESLHDPIGGEAAQPFIPGVTDFPKPTVVEETPVISYLSHGLTAGDVVGARPDDRADRFAHSDVPGQPELASSTSRVEWDDGLALGIGAVVLALALGLGLGFVKRPRLAGM